MSKILSAPIFRPSWSGPAVRLFLSAFFLVVVFHAPSSRAQSDGPPVDPPTTDNPTGNSGAFNGQVTTAGSYDPYTGNATRTVVDAVVPGAAGDYGLAFARTTNSRRELTAVRDAFFGDGGNWRHSYQWSAIRYDVNGVSRYLIGYPDGRSIEFADDGSGNMVPPKGVNEQLLVITPPGQASERALVLQLANGGQVVFPNRGFFFTPGGPSSPVAFANYWRAEQIVDPHGAVIRLRYDDDIAFNGASGNRYLLAEVDEPAGRSLRLLYQTYNYTGQINGQNVTYQWTVLGEVKVVFGANVLTDVTYAYALFGTSNGTLPPPGSPPSGYPYLTLTQVSYNNEPSVSQPSTVVRAAYAYSRGTQGGRPLLHSLHDPHFGGPMADIRYKFAPYSASSTVPWGTIVSESHEVPSNPNTESVSSLNRNDPKNPYEVRGDDQRRDFHYGETSGPGSTLTGARAYNLTSFTDFEGHLSYQGYDAAGYLNKFTDRKGNVTTYDHEPITGKLTSVHLPDALGSHRDFTYTDAAHPDTSKPYYLYRSTDERGNATVITRAHPADATAHLVTRVDYPDTGYELFTYQAFTVNTKTFYKLASRRTVLGATLAYTYDEANHGGSGLPGLLTSSSRPKGDGDTERVTVNYYYDAFDRLVRVRDERLNDSWIGDNQGQGGYNGRQQAIRITHTDSSFAMFSYDDYGNLLTTTDELGHPTTVTYDDYRRPVTLTESVNDSVSGIVSRTTTTTYERNLGGNIFGPYTHTSSVAGSVRLPSGKALQHFVTPNLTPDRDLAGLQVDAQGNVQPTADTTATAYSYDPNDNLAFLVQQASSGVNLTTGYTYDGRNRPLTSTAPNGTVSAFSYDAASNLLQVDLPFDTQSNPNHGPLIYGDYDPMNRPRLAQDPKGQPTRVTYDVAGDVLTLTDGDTHPATTFGYDLLGRSKSINYADSTTEAWTYDAAGNLFSFQNRAGSLQTFRAYDNRNRPTGYDWSNNNAPGVGMVFDAANRLTSLTNPNSTLSYTYNDANEPTGETQAIGGTNPRTVTYTLNADSLPRKVGYPGRDVFARTFDKRNELVGVGFDGGAALAGYNWNGDGTPALRSLGNATNTTFGYDANGRINDTNTVRAGSGGTTTPISHRQYGYTPNDQLSWFNRVTEQPATINYVPYPGAVNQTYVAAPTTNTGDACIYDAAGQLTQILQDAGNVQGADAGHGNFYANPAATNQRHQHAFTYDAAGNRQDSVFDGTTTTNVTDGLNRYTSYTSGNGDGDDYLYDPLGNTTYQLGWYYTYDAQGRLLSASTLPPEDSATTDSAAFARGSGTASAQPGSPRYPRILFSYDALGRCVRRDYQTLAPPPVYPGSYQVITQDSVLLTYDGWDLIEERDGNQNLLYRYVHGAGTDEMICRLDGSGQVLYYHYDALGDVTHLTNAAGSVVESYRYMPYGRPEVFDAQGYQLLDGKGNATSAVANRFLFKGREYLEGPELYDLRNRHYSSRTGRFLQPDPAGFGASGINLYAYCGNDPVNGVDPSGLDPSSQVIVITGSRNLSAVFTGGSSLGGNFSPRSRDEVGDAARVPTIYQEGGLHRPSGDEAPERIVITDSPLPNRDVSTPGVGVIPIPLTPPKRSVYVSPFRSSKTTGGGGLASGGKNGFVRYEDGAVGQVFTNFARKGYYQSGMEIQNATLGILELEFNLITFGGMGRVEATVVGAAKKAGRDYRIKTTGANALDKKIVDQAAKRAKIQDRDGFGNFVEEAKGYEGRGGSNNYTFKQLLELAEEFKQTGGK